VEKKQKKMNEKKHKIIAKQPNPRENKQISRRRGRNLSRRSGPCSCAKNQSEEKKKKKKKKTRSGCCCMIFAASSKLLALAALALPLALPAARAQTDEPLPALGADMGSVTVSGISAGAFMAVQLHVAHSRLFRGAGVVAGGPFVRADTFFQCSGSPWRPPLFLMFAVTGGVCFLCWC
jgi:hypothetical protein